MPKNTPLIAAILAVVLVLASGAGYSIYEDYRSTLVARYAISRDMAKVVDDHLHRTVRGADLAISFIRNMVTRAGGPQNVVDEQHWIQLKEYASGVDGALSLWLFDADGNTVLESGQFPPRTVNVADRAYFQSAKRGEPFFIGPAVRAKASNSIFYPISRPLLGPKGEFVGVIQASMDASWLTDFYALMDFGMDPLVTVARTDGTIVARGPDLEQYLGKTLAGGQLMRAIEQAPEGTYESVSVLDGKTRLAAYRLASDLGVIILAGLEKEQALATWRSRSLRMGGIAAASAVLIVGAFMGLLRFLRQSQAAQIALVEAKAETQQVTAELSQARHDSLTGLPSRGLWQEMAEGMQQRSQADGMRMAVMLVDLDGFKVVNDQHGHERGDEVLEKAAEVLRGALRDTDIAGRLGGDEFAICAMGRAEDIQQRASKIAARVVERMGHIGNGIGCSIGVALCPLDCSDLGCALRKADEAMYQAKRQGKNRFVLWGDKRADAAWAHPNGACAC